jgi:hypothetical protein
MTGRLTPREAVAYALPEFLPTEDADMEILDLQGSREFSSERHVYKFLAETPFCSISVVGWEPGQTSPSIPIRGPTRSTMFWKARVSSTTDTRRCG